MNGSIERVLLMVLTAALVVVVVLLVGALVREVLGHAASVLEGVN